MTKVYWEAEKRRKERVNAEAHLMGLYVYEALCDVSPIFHAFAKKGTKALPYRTEPYDLFGEKEKQREKDSRKEEAERLRAEIYMKQMMRAGKNWGKKSN